MASLTPIPVPRLQLNFTTTSLSKRSLVSEISTEVENIIALQRIITISCKAEKIKKEQKKQVTVLLISIDMVLSLVNLESSIMGAPIGSPISLKLQKIIIV